MKQSSKRLYIHMSDYQTGKTLNLKDDGVYINAKLAEILDLKLVINLHYH